MSDENPIEDKSKTDYFSNPAEDVEGKDILDKLTPAQRQEVVQIISASQVKPQKKLKLSSTTFTLLLVGSMLGGGIGVTLGSSISKSLIDSTSNNGIIEITNPEDINWLSAVALKTTPSVVSVLTLSNTGDASGSGIVFDEAGHIITSAHLFKHSSFENLKEITVEIKFTNGEVVAAEVKGVDLAIDLAVLKILEKPKEFELVPAVWRDSETVQVGEYVASIGSPLELYNSVSKGVISSTDRVIQLSRLAAGNGTAGLSFAEGDIDDGITLKVIQTDAAINPGSSGGGLVDTDGKFIGLNAAISGSDSTRGLGFVVPSNNILRVVNNIIEKGINNNGYVGAIATNKLFNPENPVSFSEGSLIVEVAEEGPADKAGIKKDFVVTLYQNKYRINSSSDLVGWLRSTDSGTTVLLTGYYVGAEEEIITYEVTLGVAPNGL